MILNTKLNTGTSNIKVQIQNKSQIVEEIPNFKLQNPKQIAIKDEPQTSKLRLEQKTTGFLALGLKLGFLLLAIVLKFAF